jgi:hypothetical protein
MSTVTMRRYQTRPRLAETYRAGSLVNVYMDRQTDFLGAVPVLDGKCSRWSSFPGRVKANTSMGGVCCFRELAWPFRSSHSRRSSPLLPSCYTVRSEQLLCFPSHPSAPEVFGWRKRGQRSIETQETITLRIYRSNFPWETSSNVSLLVRLGDGLRCVVPARTGGLMLHLSNEQHTPPAPHRLPRAAPTRQGRLSCFLVTREFPQGFEPAIQQQHQRRKVCTSMISVPRLKSSIDSN